MLRRMPRRMPRPRSPLHIARETLAGLPQGVAVDPICAHPHDAPHPARSEVDVPVEGFVEPIRILGQQVRHLRPGLGVKGGTGPYLGADPKLVHPVPRHASALRCRFHASCSIVSLRIHLLPAPRIGAHLRE